MAKRFTATEIWEEDWFLEMPTEYKLFWYYMLSNCDHAGLFKLNLRSFCGLNEVKLTSTIALNHFNTGKQRIRVISESVWFIEDFFVYQYGTTFNWNNRVHASIGELYKRQKINLTSIRGLLDLKDRVKDKDKDKDKDSIINGNGENKISALYFKDGFAHFPDETTQPLNEVQISLLKDKRLKPTDIKKVSLS